MTDNVVIFGKKPEKPAEPRIWVCLCGCKDFKLYENETIKCSLCGKIGEGHWTKNLVDSDEPEPAYQRTAVDHGSIDFAKKSVMRDANDDDTMVLMVARRNGTIRLWTRTDELETDEQKAWLRTCFGGAAALALGEKWVDEKYGPKP